MLKAIHAQESRDAADRKARAIVDDLRTARMNTAADLVERSVSETLTYYAFPDIHWQKIRTNNPLERIMREIRRRTRVVERSPTASHASTWRPHDCATSSAPHGKCYMNMRPSTTSKTAPRDARELVGKRDRQHIVMQPLLGYLDPRLEPVAFPSVRLHLHKRDPCCKYGTPRLQA